MLMTNDFKPDIDLPYYTPCLFPLINERVKLLGSCSFTSLLININLMGLPCYSNCDNSLLPRVNVWDTLLLKEARYRKKTDCLFAVVLPGENTTLENGLSMMEERLNNNIPFIVGGTTYYIPYSPDYQDKDFINKYNERKFNFGNHMLMVYGASDEDVFVYDPIPNKYLGKLSKENFKLFWGGDKNIPGLAYVNGIENVPEYSYLDLQINQKFSREMTAEVMFKIFKTIACEYMEGFKIRMEDKNYYFGKLANEQLEKDMLLWCNEDGVNASLSEFVECIFEKRFSRCFFRDFIKDMVTMLDGPYAHFYSELNNIIETIEKIYNILFVRINRTHFRKNEVLNIVNMLSKVNSMELKLFNEICNLNI